MAQVRNAPKSKAGNGRGQAEEVARHAPAAPGKLGASPFAFMRRFAEQMDQFLEDYGLESGLHMPSVLTRGREMLRREAGLVPADWSPRVDVLERDGTFLVRADLPGLARDDVKVEITDDLLTIHGERKQEKKEDREGYNYSECSYGSFRRTIPLPEGADHSKATAVFRNGVLEVAMPAPARPEKQRRQVEVREG